MSNTNELYQYSLVSALLSGLADHGIPLSALLSHGNHGLGTFLHLDGEMIVIDGVPYHMQSSGSITPLSDPDIQQKTLTPFATITRFEPTLEAALSLQSKEDLFKGISSLLTGLPMKNHFLAIRVDGAFEAVTVRTVGGQRYHHEGLVSVGEHQTNHTFTSCEGSIVGFRSPGYMQGIGVAGDHLHFITADRKKGGHLLEMRTRGMVDVRVALVYKLHLELPRGDREFDEAELGRDDEGIKKVEG